MPWLVGVIGALDLQQGRYIYANECGCCDVNDNHSIDSQWDRHSVPNAAHPLPSPSPDGGFLVCMEYAPCLSRGVREAGEERGEGITDVRDHPAPAPLRVELERVKRAAPKACTIEEGE